MKLSDIKTEEQPTEGKLKLSSIQQEPPGSVADTVKGLAFGIPALAGAGYGLYKSKIPQFIGKGTMAGIEGFGNLPKVLSTQKSADFANTIRESFIKVHSDKVAEFGGQIDNLIIQNPTRSVSLQNVVDDIKTNLNDLTPEVKSVIRKTPYLRDMIKTENPLSPNINLKQTQEIINYMNTKVPKNIRANNLDLIDAVNNIRGAQLDAFPEMEGVKASYKTFIEPYNQIKNYFKFNKILNAIKNKFGGAEGQVAAEKILPKEVIRKMRGYRRGAKLTELPGDIPIIGKTLRSLGGMMGIAPSVLQAEGMRRAYEEAKKKGMFTIDNFGNIIPLSREDLAI